jgi:UDP-N-acetylglucosamine 2-epimerase (non-hydrolysing)
MKLLFILGTRPDAIKLAPVIKVAKNKKGIKTFICLTAQHRQMLDQVIKFFDIKPDFDLNLMSPNQKLSAFTAEAIRKTDTIIKQVKPDWVIVQGDTTTTFVGALCAFYHRIKVAHVEAGLRTNNKYAPFPEEVNRVLTTKLADIHFAPTRNAKQHLLIEGVVKDKIIVTGNTGIDALLWVLKKIDAYNLDYSKTKFSMIDFSKRILLVTGHRRENFGKPFREICLALKAVAGYFPEIEIVYPVHLNPNIKNPIFNILSGISNIHLIEPLDYISFIWLMKQAYFILTDSGGIQEEAPTLKKPVLVMRDVSERPEGLDIGVAKLVGTERKKIINSVKALLQNEKKYKDMLCLVNPYGDGKASRRIIETLIHA